MFYGNKDYYFSIIVSLIVLPANNVTQTKTACSILPADLHPPTQKKAHYLPKYQGWRDNRLVCSETKMFAFVGLVLSSYSQANKKLKRSCWQGENSSAEFSISVFRKQWLDRLLNTERKSSLTQPWDLNHRQFSSMSRGGNIRPFCISTGETWAPEALLEWASH